MKYVDVTEKHSENFSEQGGNMPISRYSHTICPVDTSLLDADQYTFFVLQKILKYENTMTITDHKNLIICYSCSPFPVWMWVKDGTDDSIMANVYDIIKHEFPFNEGYRFNVKYGTADYIIKRAAEDGIKIAIRTNISAYRCKKLIAPAKIPDGIFEDSESGNIGTICVSAKERDLDEIVSFLKLFHQEIKMDEKTDEQYRNKAEGLIYDGRLFVCRNAKGDCVSMCSYGISGDKASVNQVYTKPSERRKGYAALVVYHVTKLIMDMGKEPVIYTDSDYAASNACYKGLGYELQGKLCAIESLQQ